LYRRISTKGYVFFEKTLKWTQLHRNTAFVATFAPRCRIRNNLTQMIELDIVRAFQDREVDLSDLSKTRAVSHGRGR
jgi:hypothetical protein